MAMDRPMYMDSRAIPNASPTENTVRISSDTLSETQFIILGMSLSPISRLTIMNIRMLAIITMRLLTSMAGLLLAMMGVIIDRMMTCPMSSMMVMRTSISMCSLSRRFWDLSTAMTTAVLDPDMIAPRHMLWTMSNPRNMPANAPPSTIKGSCITATSIAKSPCLRIFLRLISSPMQNINRTRPMSDSMPTMSSLSWVTVQMFAMMIPATMYPMSGGSLILLKTMEQAAASSMKSARFVRSTISSTHPPKGRLLTTYLLRLHKHSGNKWFSILLIRNQGVSRLFGATCLAVDAKHLLGRTPMT